MNIAILSRGPQLYSTQSIWRAGMARGHNMRIIDHTRCQLIMEKGVSRIHYNNLPLRNIDAIIPRIGASVTMQGAMVIRHFEMLNVFSLTRSQALLLSRNKLQSLQKLSLMGIDIPKTIYVGSDYDLYSIINEVGGPPIVVKLLESTHGIGVILAETAAAAQASIELFHKLKQQVMIQEFIHESKGVDVRAFVVGNKIVACMERKAQAGEFRSNLHRGATARIVNLSKEEEAVVIKAASLMGLEVAGVDLLRSKRGPLIMEVNASPGLEGIETTTNINIAGNIIRHIERKAKRFHHHKKNLTQSP